MTTDAYPNDDDMRELENAHNTLTANGVQPGQQGFDMSTLAAVAYAHGWSYNINRRSAGFQAEIRPRVESAGQFHAVGIGWTADVAMVFALRQAVTQMARQTATST